MITVTLRRYSTGAAIADLRLLPQQLEALRSEEQQPEGLLTASAVYRRCTDRRDLAAVADLAPSTVVYID